MGIRFLTTTFTLLFFSAATLFAREESILARITVYWRGEGQLRACSNGVRLRTGHCAVDPKRIPYGSHVIFPDAECVAVDSGPSVVNRKAARVCGRTAAQRNALVIDRFFESKETALLWSRSHPQFMTVRVLPPPSSHRIADAITPDGMARPHSLGKKSGPAARKVIPNQPALTSSLPKFDSAKLELHLPLDSVLRPVRRKA